METAEPCAPATGDILLVDDSPESLQVLEAILRREGYRVRTAEAGAAALALGWEGPPEVVLLDVRLPDMDGFEVCRQLKAEPVTRSVPILFISGLEDQVSRLAGFQAGGVDYLTKPFRREEILARVRTHLGLRRVQRELEEDIERRRKTEEALRQSEEKFFRAFRSSPSIVTITVLDDNRFLEVNEAFLAVTGYARDEVIGHSSVELGLWDDPLQMKGVVRTLRTVGSVRNLECLFRAKGGREVWGLLSSERIELEGRDCAITSILDVTERRRERAERARMNERLVLLQRLESVGTLAGGVAHEINNPLNVILNYTDLLAPRVQQDAEATDMVRQIAAYGERIAGIVQNLLVFAQEERRPRRPTPVADVVTPALDLLRASLKGDGIRLETHLPADLPRVRCHRQQLRQVLVNLLTNARDALNERYPGGDADKVLVVTALRRPVHGLDGVRITVENHGTDIPADVLPRLFEPFFSTKPRGIGTGLGLSTSHGIVTEHHGLMSVETEPGRWTRFHVDLPVEGQGEAAHGGDPEADDGANAGADAGADAAREGQG